MKLIISSDYKASVDTTLLGYAGEANARTIEVEQPEVDGADTYRLRFDYGGVVIYDVPIQEGTVLITGSLLPKAGNVRCQMCLPCESATAFQTMLRPFRATSNQLAQWSKCCRLKAPPLNRQKQHSKPQPLRRIVKQPCSR